MAQVIFLKPDADCGTFFPKTISGTDTLLNSEDYVDSLEFCGWKYSIMVSITGSGMRRSGFKSCSLG